MAENGEVVIIDEDVLFRAIRDYKPTSSFSSGQFENCKIRKVQLPDTTQANTRSPYTPKIISIGPLHHGKRELQPMEDLKHKYLNKLLKYRGKDNLSSDGKNDELLRRFLEAARTNEEEVRRYYELSDINTISSDDFVRMLVIDGCLLLEFLMRRNFKRKSELLRLHGPLINQDILLFENQIPFLVLEAFYEILKNYGVYESSTMMEVAYRYLYFNKWEKSIMTFLGSDYDESIMKSQPSNLLHLYHKMVFSENHPRPPFIDLITRIVRKWTMTFFSWLFAIVSSPLYFIHKIFFANITYPTNLTSAMEIEEAGVRLQGSPVDLRFEQGTLLIPILALNQQSLGLLKNLMIFEFYCDSIVNPYVHTYVSFLSDLIMNPGDLKVMEKHHIIITRAGGDESFRLVSDLFREHVALKFREKTLLRWQDLLEIQVSLWMYCQKPRHRWRGKLMKDYFGNPWSTLGVLVGVILLVLTTLQTVFTVLSYYQ